MTMTTEKGKIYFYVYPSAFQNPGGGEVLLLKTKEYLEKLGVTIHLFDMWNDRLKQGDLLHVFGSVKEALGLMEVAKTKGVRIVHSPIIWYNWQSSLRIPYPPKERLLCVLRQAVKTFVPIAPSPRKKMMELADLVSASSHMEADQIVRYFLIPREKIKIVPYGADEKLTTVGGELFEQKFGLRQFVLTVGRIEPRKNQLALIRAMKQIDQTLVIIGSPVSHHQAYYKQCREEGGSKVHFLGYLPTDSMELISAFAACDVFALPTWFETPGIAALEAGLAGAKLVITREGSTREYFGELANYVNPASISDIRITIRKVLERKKSDDLREHIRRNYLWQHTALKTAGCYRAFGFESSPVMERS